MTDDPNPALRAELNAAFDIVDPQVSGLKGLIAIAGLSQASVDALFVQLDIRIHRRDLVLAAISSINAVLSAMTALEADGYPVPPPQSTAPTEILAEVQMKEHDISLAAHIFGSTSDIPLGTQTQVDELFANIEANKAALTDAMKP